MEIARSVNKVPIRLTYERWIHITEEHSELAGYLYDILETIENPEIIYEGNAGEHLAVKEIEFEKFLVVVYREINKDNGFVIAAFFTRRKNQLERRNKIWPN